MTAAQGDTHNIAITGHHARKFKSSLVEITVPAKQRSTSNTVPRNVIDIRLRERWYRIAAKTGAHASDNTT